GGICAARRAGASGADVDFTVAANTIGTLGSFNDGNHTFKLSDQSSLTETGVLIAANTTLLANPSVSLGGTIETSALVVDANASITLLPGNTYSGLAQGSTVPLNHDKFPTPGQPGV